MTSEQAKESVINVYGTVARAVRRPIAADWWDICRARNKPALGGGRTPEEAWISAAEALPPDEPLLPADPRAAPALRRALHRLMSALCKRATGKAWIAGADKILWDLVLNGGGTWGSWDFSAADVADLRTLASLADCWPTGPNEEDGEIAPLSAWRERYDRGPGAHTTKGTDQE